MKTKTLATLILSAALSAFAVAGIARQNPKPQGPSAQQPPNQGKMGGGMTSQGMGPQGLMNGGMMARGLPEMMGQMAAYHPQMVELMNKLNQNLAAMEKEKNPAALKDQLAAHRALLEQMRNVMNHQGGMMQSAQQFAANCPMLGSSKQPDSK